MTQPSQDKRFAGNVLRRLKKAYPDANCTLDFDNPLQLLIATILSAQCTDERVNQVTPALFAKYRNADDFARAQPAELEEDIHATGFFRNKAKSIIGACGMISADHGGQVPAEMDALVALPGVGRKTANVVLGNAYDLACGVVVDTHVQRLARRLGLTREKTPDKIERDLMAVFPQSEWVGISHRLILHGRGVCNARKPKCEDCVLGDICPRIGVAP